MRLPSVAAHTQRQLALGGLALIAFAIYAPVLRFVIFHDDIQIWLTLLDRTPLNIFESRASDDLYRPISYAAWMLVRDGFGLAPALLHFINLACHVLNVTMVSALTMRTCQRWHLSNSATALRMGLLSGLIFALFPFSYQSVEWASAVVHPLMVCFGLMGLNAYGSARVAAKLRGSRSAAFWLTMSVLCLLAACFTHEMGFLFGLSVVWCEALAWLRDKYLFWLAALPASACGLFLLLFWLLGRSTWSGANAASLSRLNQWSVNVVPNMLCFAQGFVAWIVILLRPRIGLIQGIEWVLLALFIISLVVGFWVQWRTKLWRLGLLGLGLWFIGSIGPSIALVQSYVSGGPRLMYLSSIGVAIFWAAFGVACLQRVRPILLRLSIVFLMGGWFVWCQIYIFSYTEQTLRYSQAQRAIAQDARMFPSDSRVLIINAPGSITSSAVPFWLTRDGVPLWPPYIPDNGYLLSGEGRIMPTLLLQHAPSFKPGVLWGIELMGQPVEDSLLRAQLRQFNLIYGFEYDGEGLRARKLGQVQPIQSTQPIQPLASLIHEGGQVSVTSALAARCGNDVVLTVSWVASPAPARPVGIFVHGFDASNQQIIVADADPLAGYWPLNELPENLRLTEFRLLRNVPTLNEIRLGVYFRDTLKRLQTLRADGSPWNGDEIALPVTGNVCSSNGF